MHAVGSLPRSEDKEREMGRKLKCGKKEMQWTWLVVAVAGVAPAGKFEMRSEVRQHHTRPRAALCVAAFRLFFF